MSGIVERLRAREINPIFGVPLRDFLHDEAADEIERLNNVLQLALDEKAQVIVEVERLRGLLREWLAWNCAPGFEDRVREALGDE